MYVYKYKYVYIYIRICICTHMHIQIHITSTNACTFILGSTIYIYMHIHKFCNRICQILFDRDCDQLQVDTIKNDTADNVWTKRESVYEALGYLWFVFASRTETDFLVSYSPEYKLEWTVQVSARKTNPRNFAQQQVYLQYPPPGFSNGHRIIFEDVCQ